MTTYTIVAQVEDDCGEEWWDAFPPERTATAVRVHADTVRETCACEIHAEWRARTGPARRIGTVELPDVLPVDPRVGLTVDGKPVHVVHPSEYTWHD